MNSNDFKKYEIKKRYPLMGDLINALKDEWETKNKDEIVKRLRRIIPKESFYQKAILEYLNNLEIPHWAVKIAQGPYSKAGIPDILFESGGRCVHFEVKRPYIGVASKLQEEAIDEITLSGGSAYIVSFPEEVRAILIREGFIKK